MNILRYAHTHFFAFADKSSLVVCRLVFKGIYEPEINCAISPWRVGGLLGADGDYPPLEFALIEAIRRQWTAWPLLSSPHWAFTPSSTFRRTAGWLSELRKAWKLWESSIELTGDILGHVMWCDFVDRWWPPPLQRWCYKSGLPKPARRLLPPTLLNPNHPSSTLPWPPFRIQLTLQVALLKCTFYEWLWHCFHKQTCLSLNALTSPPLYHSWHMVLSPKLSLSRLIMLFVTHQHTLTTETPFMLIFLQ